MAGLQTFPQPSWWGPARSHWCYSWTSWVAECCRPFDIFTGWCFGTWTLFFHIILGRIIPMDQLIIILQKGGSTTDQFRTLVPNAFDTRSSHVKIARQQSEDRLEGGNNYFVRRFTGLSLMGKITEMNLRNSETYSTCIYIYIMNDWHIRKCTQVVDVFRHVHQNLRSHSPLLWYHHVSKWSRLISRFRYLGMFSTHTHMYTYMYMYHVTWNMHMAYACIGTMHSA